jgi:hypothetical protein
MAVKLSRDNDRLNLNLALNYGGRSEITSAIRAIASAVEAGRLKASQIDAGTVEELRHRHSGKSFPGGSFVQTVYFLGLNVSQQVFSDILTLRSAVLDLTSIPSAWQFIFWLCMHSSMPHFMTLDNRSTPFQTLFFPDVFYLLIKLSCIRSYPFGFGMGLPLLLLTTILILFIQIHFFASDASGVVI